MNPERSIRTPGRSHFARRPASILVLLLVAIVLVALTAVVRTPVTLATTPPPPPSRGRIENAPAPFQRVTISTISAKFEPGGETSGWVMVDATIVNSGLVPSGTLLINVLSGNTPIANASLPSGLNAGETYKYAVWVRLTPDQYTDVVYNVTPADSGAAISKSITLLLQSGHLIINPFRFQRLLVPPK
jgi:hypothetical protein